MKSSAFRIVLVALSCMTAWPAGAAFIDEGGTGEFRVVGKVDQNVMAVGLGRKVLLHDAVRQIIPSEYSLRLGQGMDSLSTKRVTWRGGRPWTDVLSDVLASLPEVSVEIDVPTRLVTLTAVSAARSESRPEKQPSEQRTWSIKSGDKLSDALAAWGRDAGWQGVLWEAPELMAEMDVTFSGSFEDAVTDTVESLARSGTQLRVVFYGGNKVVRILESK